MNSRISIIVPIYKVEKYLPACVNSLLNQTYTNIEIILVDDGSPDSCGNMCDEYAKKDDRIKVIHKKNGGLSDARNAGYPYITGDYVAFIDSDDCVADNMLEILLSAMEKENSDIVECDVQKFDDGTEPQPVGEKLYKIQSYITQDALKELMNDGIFHQHVWNKLYKKQVLNKILFAKGKLNEDEFWTYRVFGNAKKVTKVDYELYFYLQRAGSIMGESYSLRRLDGLEAKAERQKYIDESFPALSSTARVNFYVSCFYAYQMTLKYLQGDDKKKAKNIILNYIDGNRITSADMLTVENKKLKLWLKMSKVSFGLTCSLRNWMKVGE